MMFLKGVPHNTSFYSNILCPTFFTPHLYRCAKEEKNPVNKNQGWEPNHKKYKANENTSKCKTKDKTKVNNQQKIK
jgi:hypothetical protein